MTRLARRLVAPLAAALFACAFLGGCDDDDGSISETCVEDMNRTCVCATGATGLSSCEDGVWGECSCLGNPPPGDVTDPDGEDAGDLSLPPDGASTIPPVDVSVDGSEPGELGLLGSEGNPCLPGGICNPGLVCRDGVCVTTEGACQNPGDQAAIVADPSTDAVSLSCLMGCLGEIEPVGCMARCILREPSQATASDPCATCFAERTYCIVDNGLGQSCIE